MPDIFDVPGSAAGPDPADADVVSPRLDFERLDVYRVAVEFHSLASSVRLPPGRRELRDQLDRAALSIVLNTAEGAGRTGPADKARFYAMARGSAMECAALFDVLRNLGIVSPAAQVLTDFFVPERVGFVTSRRSYRAILRSDIGLSPTGLSGYPNEG